MTHPSACMRDHTDWKTTSARAEYLLLLVSGVRESARPSTVGAAAAALSDTPPAAPDRRGERETTRAAA